MFSLQVVNCIYLYKKKNKQPNIKKLAMNKTNSVQKRKYKSFYNIF